MIDNVLCWSGLGRLWSFLTCAILAAVTPTGNFILAITIGCFFNVWCGMRADGVVNIRCHNFSWHKFLRAMVEFICFLVIIETISLVTTTMGDAQAGYYACKTASYCVAYVYLDNGMKNLCKAYPKSKGLWLIYLIVHLDLPRILKINELMERYEEHTQKLQNG